MILISPPGQVRKAGCPLTPCWYAVRAAACAGSLTSSSSQRARSGSPRVRRPEAVLPNGTSWWIASTRNRPAFRSAAASSLPTSRSPYKIGNAKYPPALGDRLVHLQLIVELEDPPPDVHRSCPSRRRPAARRPGAPAPGSASEARPAHPRRRVKRDGAPTPSRLTQARRVKHSRRGPRVERQPLIML